MYSAASTSVAPVSLMNCPIVTSFFKATSIDSSSSMLCNILPHSSSISFAPATLWASWSAPTNDFSTVWFLRRFTNCFRMPRSYYGIRLARMRGRTIAGLRFIRSTTWYFSSMICLVTTPLELAKPMVTLSPRYIDAFMISKYYTIHPPAISFHLHFKLSLELLLSQYYNRMGTTVSQPTSQRHKNPSHCSSRIRSEDRVASPGPSQQPLKATDPTVAPQLDMQTPNYVHLVSAQPPLPAPDQSMSSVVPQDEGRVWPTNRLINESRSKENKQREQRSVVRQDSYDAKQAYQHKHQPTPINESPAQLKPIIRNKPQLIQSVILQPEIDKDPEIPQPQQDVAPEPNIQPQVVMTESVQIAPKKQKQEKERLDEMDWNIPKQPEAPRRGKLVPSSSIIMDTKLAQERGDYGRWQEGRKRAKSRRQVMHQIAKGRQLRSFSGLPLPCFEEVPGEGVSLCDG